MSLGSAEILVLLLVALVLVRPRRVHEVGDRIAVPAAAAGVPEGSA